MFDGVAKSPIYCVVAGSSIVDSQIFFKRQGTDFFRAREAKIILSPNIFGKIKSALSWPHQH